MSKVTELTKELQRVMYSTTYSFETDTEDVVSGFKNTIRKRTENPAEAFKSEQKVTKDCGCFLSNTVGTVSVRIYRNGELEKELYAKEMTASYNG